MATRWEDHPEVNEQWLVCALCPPAPSRQVYWRMTNEADRDVSDLRSIVEGGSRALIAKHERLHEQHATRRSGVDKLQRGSSE